MRHPIAAASILVLGVIWPTTSPAQPSPGLQTIITPYAVGPGEVVGFDQVCPDQFVPVYRTDPNRRPDTLEIRREAMDRIGQPAPLIASPAAILTFNAAGHRVQVRNRGSTTYEGVAVQNCTNVTGLVDTTSPFQRTLPPGQTTFFPISCNAPAVPVGFLTNADGIDIQERSRVYLVGQAQTPLNGLADGTYPGAPSTWGLGFRNTTAAPLQLTGHTFCANLANAQTNVVSTSVIADAPYEVFASVTDDSRLVGESFAVSGSEQTDWVAVGRYAAGLDEVSYAQSTPAVGETRGVFIMGRGIPPPSSRAKQAIVGRAIIGTLLVPSAMAVPPPVIVPIVEFYHAVLDHYFITAIAKEISDLDAGVHRGWARTDESFNAYGIGSSGRTGHRPVCRAYGNPDAGLDSHFYSASPRECIATIRDFGDDWLLEASVVFEMELPDTTTGACASDRVPIYRLGTVASTRAIVS